MGSAPKTCSFHFSTKSWSKNGCFLRTCHLSCSIHENSCICVFYLFPYKPAIYAELSNKIHRLKDSFFLFLKKVDVCLVGFDGATTHSPMTLSTTTLSINTLSMKGSWLTLSISDISITMIYNCAECRVLFIIILNVIMLSVIMLSVIMLSVIMPSIIMLSAIMLSAVMLSIVMLYVVMLSAVMLCVVMLSVIMLSVAAPFLITHHLLCSIHV